MVAFFAYSCYAGVMTAVQALILGLIQGLTEFLPISSSGHLVFIPQLFRWPSHALVFDVVLHLGTLLAVVIYFRRDLWRIVRAFTSQLPELASARKLGWLLILSTIPAIVMGLLMQDIIEVYFRSPARVAYQLIGWGIVLGLADWYNRRRAAAGTTLRTLDHISWQDALAIGVAQALALIPGTSRSGVTITAGLLLGLTRSAAAEFSFLMSVPIVALAGAKGLYDLVQLGGGNVQTFPLLFGLVTAAVSGFFAIAFLLHIIRTKTLLPFVWYRLAVGIAILIWLV